MTPEVHEPVVCQVERFVAPAGLDGARGSRRMDAQHKRTGANTDAEAILEWLWINPNTPHSTMQQQRRAAERLLNWACLVRRKALSSLDEDDLAAYRLFAANPTPPADWICRPGTRRLSPNWRPFNSPLARITIDGELLVLRSLFGWMESVGYARMPTVNVAYKSSPGQLSAVATFVTEMPVMPLSKPAWDWVAQGLATLSLQSRMAVELMYFTNLGRSDVMRLGIADCMEPVEAGPWRLVVTGCTGLRRTVEVPAPLGCTLRAFCDQLGVAPGQLANHAREFPGIVLAPPWVMRPVSTNAFRLAAGLARRAKDFDVAMELAAAGCRNLRDAFALHGQGTVRRDKFKPKRKRRTSEQIQEARLAKPQGDAAPKLPAPEAVEKRVSLSDFRRQYSPALDGQLGLAFTFNQGRRRRRLA